MSYSEFTVPDLFPPAAILRSLRKPEALAESLKGQILQIHLNPPGPDSNPQISRVVEVAVRMILDDLDRVLRLARDIPRDRGPVLVGPSGRAWYPFDPQPEDVDLEGIAIALGQTTRWRGALRYPISVAVHSVLVCRRVAFRLGVLEMLDASASQSTGLRGVLGESNAMMLRAALYHDAGEAFLGDLPDPIKQTRAGAALRHLEQLARFAIGQRIGVPDHMWTHPAIELADKEAAAIEWITYGSPSVDRSVSSLDAQIRSQVPTDGPTDVYTTTYDLGADKFSNMATQIDLLEGVR